MFCKNCGKEIADNAAFCAECGAEVKAPSVDVQQDNLFFDTPVTEPVISLNTEGETARKKSKWLIPALVSAGVLLIGVVVLLIQLIPGAKGAVEKISKSPEELNVEANQDSVGNVLHSFGDAVEGWFDPDNGNYEGEIRVQINEDLLAMLADGMDVAWLSDFAISYDVTCQDSLTQMMIEFALSDTAITSFDYILDKESLEMWMKIPDASQQSIYFDLSEEMMDSYSGSASAAMIYNVLPDWETIERPALKMSETFLNGFESVEETKETFEVDGISQELTVLKARMSVEEFGEVVITMLNQLQDDADFRQIIEKMEDSYGQDMDLYGEVMGYIDDLIEQIETNLEEGEFEDEDGFYMETYMNANNEIVGRMLKATSEGEEITVLSSLTVVQGTDVALKYCFFDKFEVIGSGKVNAETFDGVLVVSFEDQEYLELEFDDYSHGTDFATGIIRVTPMDALMDAIIEEMYVSGEIANYLKHVSIVMEIETSGTAADNTTRICFKALGMEAITITVSGRVKNPEDIVIPQNAADASDYEQMEAWAAGVDQEILLERIFGRLADAGMPMELLLALGYSGVEIPL